MRLNDAYPSFNLKAPDLPGGIFRVRIKNLKWETVGTDEKPVLNFFGGSKPLIVNKTNWRAMEEAYGDSDDWTNKEIEIVSVPVSNPAGQTVDGLRVRIPLTRKPNSSVPADEPTPPARAYDDADNQDPDDHIPF